MKLNGEDTAFLDQHNTYRDRVILVRLIELEAVMNEYPCSSVTKTAHGKSAF